MANPSVVIDIAAEYTGKKAFAQADTATQKLTKSVKTLGKGLLGVFAIQKLISYSKASVKAFAADDAAAKSLGMTLKNLGLAYSSNVGTVNGFINRLEAETGVLDDELRPAMDRLLRATGDVAKSQELLALALDISAGTGKSVTQVSQSLQKAYLGQTAALGRLGVGLTKGELATGDFEEIQKKLNSLFAGQAATAADTYQGSLNKLTVASNNAKETIGKGLVDALNILSNSSTVDPTVSAIDRIANAMADGAKETAKFIKVTQTLFSDLSFFKNDATTAAALRIKLGTGFTTPMSISSQDTQRADKLAADKAKAAAAAKARAEKAAVANKIKADKLAAANKAKLEKAAAVFDLQKIQIAAALKGKISEEEKTRLLLMKAIEEENADKAEILQKKLEDIQEKNKEIAKTLDTIATAENPFAAWASSLDEAVILLGKMPALIDATGSLTPRGKVVLPTGDGLPDPQDPPEPPPSIFEPSDTIEKIIEKVENVAEEAAAAAEEAARSVDETQKVVDDLAAAETNMPYVDENLGSSSIYSPNPNSAVGGPGYGIQAPTIIVNNNGTTIMQDEFVAVVADAVVASQRFGYGRTPAGSIT